MTSPQRKNGHLLWRAGFGPAAVTLPGMAQVSTNDLYTALKKAAAKKPEFLDATDDYLKGLWQGIQEEGMKKKQLDAETRKNVQQQTRQAIKSLNLMWLDEMVNSKDQLREKMAFFWHGHFAARNLNVFYQQELLDIIRQHALGSFRDLLHEVSKSAAMLNFLNANQNRKDHPNENFAREVMELFTLGRGNYTEKDVKEAARAFTGWGANLRGEFVFRRFQHDAGSKTVLSRTGNFTGEEVLDILLEQRQTAYFITWKVYRFFVNETVDKEHLTWLADRFYANRYDIGKLMDDIFTSTWFYDEKNIGNRIKSPVELIVGIRRVLPMELQNSEAQLLLQRLLGQMLFYPPNVAGWPGGRTWIDSSTLMVRLRLPQLFTDEDDLNVRPKSDDDQMMGKMDGMAANGKNMGRIGQPIRAAIDWSGLLKGFESTPREKLLTVMNDTLLQVRPSYTEDTIRSYTDAHSREAFVKSAVLQIMSTPEYQLC